MKHILKVDAVELNDKGKVIAAKGHMVKVIELNELEQKFMSHEFGSRTLKVMFWAQFNLNYCGG